MPKESLLPGVRSERPGPEIIADSRRAIARARRRAALRDFAQIVMLIGVDYGFRNWPLAHIPFLTREQSIVTLLVLNAGVMTHVVVSRAIPRWFARRIATTWCLAERARFFAQERR
jgi:hypothetical protein